MLPGLILVMPAEEYERARASGKFKEVKVERQIPYPDGRPGFYAVRLVYADDADRLIAEERALRARPVTEEVVVRGETVALTHSPFDIGSPKDLFDGDTATLVRGLEADPLVLDFAFGTPRPVRGLTATFGTMDFSLEAALWEEGETEPRLFSRTFRELPLDPTVRDALRRLAPAGLPPATLDSPVRGGRGRAHPRPRDRLPVTDGTAPVLPSGPGRADAGLPEPHIVDLWMCPSPPFRFAISTFARVELLDSSENGGRIVGSVFWWVSSLLKTSGSGLLPQGSASSSGRRPWCR